MTATAQLETTAQTQADEGKIRDERRQILLAREGDAVAFRRLVERHHRGLHHFVARLVLNPSDVDDLVQDSFAKAYCRLDQYNPKYRFSTWLYRIALNNVRDHARSAKRREVPHAPDEPAFDAVDESPLPDTRTEMQQEAALAQRALATLTPRYREIIVMKDVEGWTFPEISQVSGGSVPALKIRAIRARAAFRKALARQR